MRVHRNILCSERPSKKMVKLIRAISIANDAEILQRRMEKKILESRKIRKIRTIKELFIKIL